MPAGAGGGVDVLRPGVPVTGAVSQRAERGAQALVAAPAKARAFAFAGLDRDGRLAGVAGERITGWVAGATVADLGQQLGGGDHGAFEQREKDLAVGMLADRGRDLALELLDLRVERSHRRDQREHELAARCQLELADATLGRAPELCEQLRGLLAARVPRAGEKPSHARLAHTAR